MIKNFVLNAMNSTFFKSEAVSFLEKDLPKLQPERMKSAIYDYMRIEVKNFSACNVKTAWNMVNKKFEDGLETFIGKCFFIALNDIAQPLSTVICNVDSVVELLEKAKSATDAWFKEINAESSFEEVFERKFISIIKEFLEDEAKYAEAEAKYAEAEAKSAEAEDKSAEVEAKPAEVEAKPAEVEVKPAEAEAKPAEVEAKPTEAEAKTAEAEAKSAEAEAKSAEAEAKPAEVEAKTAEAEAKYAENIGNLKKHMALLMANIMSVRRSEQMLMEHLELGLNVVKNICDSFLTECLNDSAPVEKPKATETDKTAPVEKPKATEADKSAPAENSEGAMSSKDEERKVEKKLKLYLAFDPFLGPFLFVKDDNGKIVLII